MTMAKKAMIAIGILLAVVLAWLILRVSMPASYAGPAVSTVVIDAFSGKPVAGATVQVRWSALRPKGWHGSDITDIHVATVTTDAQGRFTIPAWGPVKFGREWSVYDWEPSVAVTKTGYKPGTESNTYNQKNVTRDAPLFGAAQLGLPSWSEQGIELERLENDPEANGAQFQTLDGTGPGNSNSLFIHVVHKNKVAKGRLVDAPDFPKVGFIRPEPDLTISNLVAISVSNLEAFLYNQETGYEGKSKVSISALLSPEDAKQITALVRKNIRKHNLLILSGDKPLGEIYLTMYAMSPGDVEAVRELSLPVRSNYNAQVIEAGLRQLVRR